MTRRFAACVCLLAAVGPAVALDPVDRRSREQPEVVPRAGDGRHGSCDVLRFTAAGDVLFAAGDDKTVTGWRHGDAGLETEPSKVEVLRWPAWREQLGGIKALDVSPDGKRVLVGGFGLRPSSVAILERDRPDGLPKMLLTWPFGRPGKEKVGTVSAVAFAEDGRTAAFGTEDGGVWLWRPEELKKADEAGRWCNLPLWLGARLLREEPIPGGKETRKVFDRPRAVFFRDKDAKLVAVGEAGSVVEYAVGDLTGVGTVQNEKPAPARSLFNVNDGVAPFPLRQVVYDRPRDRLVVACEATHRALVRPLAGGPATILLLPVEHFARTVAVHPKTGAVAVAVGTRVPARDDRPQFHNDADDTLHIYKTPEKSQKADVTTPLIGQGDALAFHPTADRLAVSGGDASEVTLFQLGKANVALTVVRGSGRRVWEVALGADGRSLGLRTRRDPAADQPNGRGAGEWHWMDLTRLAPAQAAPKQWAAAHSTADGWTVEPDKTDRDKWYAVHAASGARLELRHNNRMYNKPTCFTFLKATDTAPTRLIVGHYYGASLHELPRQPVKGDAKSAPVRVYVGHSGEVLTVAAVDDAKGGWFVTGGADHTVAAFNLSPWPSNAGLGVRFDEKLKVAAVDVGSPGWEAGLQADDEVLLLAAGGVRVYDVRPEAKRADARGAESNPYETDDRPAALPALAAAPDLAEARALVAEAYPTRELYFRVRAKGGATRDLASSVKQRPLWKLYPTFAPDGAAAEWVAWMWRGSYYQTASPNGDALVGWHVNGRATNQAPRFHPLGHFTGYQQNDLVRTLVRDRDLKAALDKVGAEAKRPKAKVGDAEPAPILLAVDRTEVADQPVTVRITVDRRGSDVDELPEQVELWVNDFRVKTWAADAEKAFVSEPVVLRPEAFRSEDKRQVPFGDNVITVQTRTRNGGRATATRVLTNTNKADSPNLLGLAVGVNDYKVHRVVSGERGVVGDLKYAVPDAVDVAGSFGAHVKAKGHFAGGQLGVRKDAAVVRKELLASLAALRKTAKPNDMLVLFLAGHGQLIGTTGKLTEVVEEKVAAPEKKYDRLQFAFCCPAFDTGKPGDTVVTADELFEALAGINCRKMVLLDVCHAGWAAKTDVIRQFVPNGLGPFVVAACGPGQKSHEVDDVKHGLFTSAVMEAITLPPNDNAAFAIADRDKDGKLSCQELFDYVRKRVAEERADQTPTCFPERAHLPRTAVVSAPRRGK